MAIRIREARKEDIEELFPLLLLAESSESALRWSLDNLSDHIYRLDDDGNPVGAAAVRFDGEPCEIVELGVSKERQRRGLGKQFVEWLVAEARRRGKSEILVGTSNASIENIVFYQKCGFRMEQVRKDYFWYHGEPEFEHGIRVRDMIVFRCDLAG